MRVEGIEACDKISVLIGAYGYLQLVAVAVYIGVADYRQKFGRKTAYSGESVLYELLFGSELSLVADMPQRTSAALSVNGAVGSDPVGRGCDDPLYLAVAVGFVYFQYLYFKLVPYSRKRHENNHAVLLAYTRTFA